METGLEAKLKDSELLVKKYSHVINFADEYAAEAADLSRHLAKEEFMVQNGQPGIALHIQLGSLPKLHLAWARVPYQPYEK